MSIFTKSLKTFKSDILGEEKEFKINVAIFAHFEADYGLNFMNLNDENADDIVGAKFIHSVFKANGIETTLEDILENINSADVFEFMTNYNLAYNENFTLASERLEAKSEAKEKAQNKTKKN